MRKAGSGFYPPSPKEKPVRFGANHRRKLQMKQTRRRAWVGGKGLVRGIFWLSVCATFLVGATFVTWKAYQLYLEGQIMTVNRIEVVGNHYWDASSILATSKLEVGARLPKISLENARNAITQLPGIQAVSVKRSWDGEIKVMVTEESILGVHKGKQGKWIGLTQSGRWLPLTGLNGQRDVPILEGALTENSHLASFLGEVHSTYPDLFRGFSQVVIREGKGSDADIYWRDGRVKIKVDYRIKSLNSLEFLKTLLQRESEAWPSGSTVDLRVEGYAYVI